MDENELNWKTSKCRYLIKLRNERYRTMNASPNTGSSNLTISITISFRK